MTDVVIIAIVLLIVAAAAAYVIKAKKSGTKCIGCPDGCSCGKNGSSCGCCGTGK